MTSIKNKIEALRKSILKYEYFYHTLDQPIVSDAEYDYLLHQLYELEKKHKEFITPDSPTQKVGSDVLKKFKKVVHFTPMLSLENTFDLDGYLNFEKKIKKIISSQEISLCCELKIDGVAISIIYEDGILRRVSTRGDGIQGENITSNARMISSIPYKLKGLDFPKRLEIRGEVFMLKSDFKKLNEENKLHKNKYFSNPRNATAGSLRSINPSVTYQRKLMFFCYSCYFFSESKIFLNHYDQLMKCLDWGIPVCKDIVICFKFQEILKFYKKIEKKRNFLNFDIDGIVIKVNSLKLQKKLGLGSKSPKWAIAFKFPSNEKITKLNKVKFQVGRTGIITPVAYFNAINISGVIIKKASLYNKNEIEKLNLHIDDFIRVCRSGDVIPKIVGVIKNTRFNNAKKIIFPKFCPVCETRLLENSIEKTVRCHAGLICNAQKSQALHHFFSKKALYVKGLSLVVICQLIKKGYVKDPIDFFYLVNNELMELKNIGYKKSKKIIYAIQNCKKTTFKRFIYALGIFKVGEMIAEKIANHFITLEKLVQTNLKELKTINGIGKIVSENIFNYFSINTNVDMINRLNKKVEIFYSGLNVYDNNFKKNFFYKKRVVITGVFTYFSRIELKNILVDNLGAYVSNSISKKTNVLIYGKNFGSKFFQAKLFDVKFINEEDFHFLIKKN